MNVEETLGGVLIIKPQIFEDNRGWFCETYNWSQLTEYGVNVQFIQDNQSMSIYKHTFRGIHFQKGPYAQAKLVRCLSGSVIDFCVDLRKDSPTFLKWISVELSAANMKQVFLPKGFGHAFLSLEENSQIAYKVDAPWSRESERSINYMDPQINLGLKDNDYILSEKDKKAPLLKDCDI